MNKFLVRVVLICCSCLFLLQSCKSKSAVVSNTKNDIQFNGKNTIENYYNNKVAFSTLYIKSNVRYDDGKQSQNVTAEIKIKKDEQILVSIRFLGITMAKALITPKTVGYYEKIKGTYFEGDFSTLSQWLGTDLDYDKVQNMLLGRAIDDLRIGKYTESKVDQTIQLDEVLDSKMKKSFFFDANTYLLKNQEIEQTSESRKIQIGYSNHSTYKEAIVPLTVLIHTFQAKGTTEINLEYNTVTFNEELSFPYAVPNDYKRIIIK
jgi:hypothetical protein